MERTDKIWIAVSVAVAIVVIAGLAIAYVVLNRPATPGPSVDGGVNANVPVVNGNVNGPAVNGPADGGPIVREPVPHPEIEFDVEKVMTPEQKAERGITTQGEVRYKYVRGTNGSVVLLVLGGDEGPADADKDGLPDAEEARLGTDPQNPDTDGDGVLDGTEVAQRTDPKDPASSASPAKP